jgi:hypothetical protein
VSLSFFRHFFLSTSRYFIYRFTTFGSSRALTSEIARTRTDRRTEKIPTAIVALHGNWWNFLVVDKIAMSVQDP